MPITKIAASGFSDAINFRNIVINGDMTVSQRATSTASITAGGYKTIDRFRTFINNTAGTWTQSQSTTVPTGEGFVNSLKMDCTTAKGSLSAGDILSIRQAFEGQSLQYLNKGRSTAKSLTASFWVRSNKTGTYIVELEDRDNTRYVSQSYTISSADTWEKKRVTFPGDTSGGLSNDNGESIRFNFWLAGGTNYTSGTLGTTWHTTNANRAVGSVNLADSTDNEWYVTGVQLEAGDTASEFEFLPPDINKIRCLRYCYSEPQGDSYHAVMNGFFPTTSLFIGLLNLPVKMRDTPTLTTSGNFAAAGTGDYSASSFTLNDMSLSDYSSVQVRASVSSVTAGQGANLRNNNDTSATFVLSAEI